MENGPGRAGTYTGPLCAPVNEGLGDNSMEISPASPIASPSHIPSYATVAAVTPPPAERMDEDIVPLTSRISLDVPGPVLPPPLASQIFPDV
jgi:hypothetical protein